MPKKSTQTEPISIMKKLLTILTLAAFAVLPATTFAAKDKKEAPAPAPGTKPAEAVPAEAKPDKPAEGKEGKAISLNAKVDTIDAAAKTFSHNNADGTVVKFIVTDKTEIKNGDADAKFEDIKVGDTVKGSRMKKSATEYDVVKITKFGVAPAKEKKGDGDKKPEGEKKADAEKKDQAPKKVEGPGKPAEKAEKKP